MEKTDKDKKAFDTVQTFRNIKETIAQDISSMSFDELKAYLKKAKLKHVQS